MKHIRVMLSVILTVLFMLPVPVHSEDIDIYSGLGTTTYVPNLLFVMDNAANFSAEAGGAMPCTINGAPNSLATASGNQTVGGIEQCALYNVIQSLPTNADGSALVNIGMMVYNSNNIRDFSNQNCGAASSTGGCLAHPLVSMNAAGKTSFLNWIASWKDSSGTGNGQIKANGAATAVTMQEAWAYFYGAYGVSGRNYSTIKPASGCQKNFVIFIGNSYGPAGTPSDPSSIPATSLANAISGLTKPTVLSDAEWATQKTVWNTKVLNTVNTSCPVGTAFTFDPNDPHDTKGYYADEWARFMNESDLYTAKEGKQSITTYTIGILGASCQAAYAATLKNMADYGGGKYFPTNDYEGLKVAILKILNEVQAVNSVFASSSLPVSVNAQGTYLNQIYMGMFRPDPGALPRWVGNLKQYKFVMDPATNLPLLGDSLGEPAISSSGTGFISPNAISYWTCSRSDNPYISNNLSAAQSSKLSTQGQICANDPVGGFWKNFSSMNYSPGKGFDLADGELVEKGAVAQQIRQDNLTDDYVANPSTPRKLYTYCPSGASCNTDLTDSSNAFATSNLGIAAAMFGSDTSVNVSTLTRLGSTATVTTFGKHGFNTGDFIKIANASQTPYNGTFQITVIDDYHFRYSMTVYPPAPATGTYEASIAGAAKPTTLVRVGNTVTATSSAHGFVNGDTVIIKGADQQAYNGSFVISGVTTDTFQYTVLERPLPAAPGANAIVKGKKQATGQCPDPCYSQFRIGSISRVGTTVTVNTAVNNDFLPVVNAEVSLSGVVDANGDPIPEYNGNFFTTSWNTPTNNRSFTFQVVVTPRTPATGSITAHSPYAIKTITGLSRMGDYAIATVPAHGYFSTTDYLNGITIKAITSAPHEEAYVGTFIISQFGGDPVNKFLYTIQTQPSTIATGLGGANITATRIGGFSTSDRDKLINWVRGEDNFGDETGPGGGVTIRPSVHGDVLHSRPTVLNYGGAIISIDGTSDSGTTRTATAAAAEVAKIGAVGALVNVKFPTGHICKVTVASATTFTYPATNCGDTGAQSVITDKAEIVVFYGDNSGVFHAINGNQTNPPGSTMPAPGSELWGFIPSEHFTKLNRLRTNSPQLSLPLTPPGIEPEPRKKNYFIDGPAGVYQLLDTQGKTLKAHLYLAMRRGGNLIYALDVTNPQAPRFMWRVSNTTAGMSELGQTWSTPKVAMVKGHSNPVLIFGAGYDTNQDVDPPIADDTIGRGIFVLDAMDGSIVWRAIYGAGYAGANSGTTFTTSGTPPTAYSEKMLYSIPSDIALVDRNKDGYIDRLYVGDTGGRVWRVDTEPGGNVSPGSWKLHRLASLGGCYGTGIVCRKIFYPPEVITTSDYDAVILGSGDREHPLAATTGANSKQNNVFLLKDVKIGNDATGMTLMRHTSDSSTDLCDATNVTSGTECTSCLGSHRGYYINLLAGEKVVNAPLVTAGYVYLGTNRPSTEAESANRCVNLGEAKGHRLSPFTCEHISVVFAGGGLPPSPVSGVVNIEQADGTTIQVPFLIGGVNPDCNTADCKSALGGQKPEINVSTSRIRTYWYKEGK